MKSRTVVMLPLLAGVFLLVAPYSALAVGSWQWKYYYQPSGISDFGGMHVADDGQHIAAMSAAYPGSKNVYISSNAGVSWTTPYSLYGQVYQLQNIVGSTDGKYRYLTSWGGYVHASSDYGATWATTTLPLGNWQGIASSYDGKHLIANQASRYVWTSSDYGASWTSHPEFGNRNWTGLDISADGRTMIAAALDGNMFITHDARTTWSQVNPGAGPGVVDLGDAAVSGDGRTMMVARYNNVNFTHWLYTSRDGGVSWSLQPNASSIPPYRFFNLQMTYDGSMAVVSNSGIGTRYSTDYGANWQSVNFPYQNSNLLAGAIAMSKSGVFAALPWASGGYIVTGSYAELPATVSLSAYPTAIALGQSSTLTWSSANATACVGTGFTTGGATSGSVKVTPTQTTTYNINCTGAGASGSASATVLVAHFVVGSRVQTVASTDVYTQAQIGKGSKVACTEAAGTLGTIAGGPQTDSSSNAWWQVSYDNGCSGWTLDSLLAPDLASAVTVSLSATRLSIVMGQSLTLAWSSANATYCTGTGFSTGGATSGSISVTPPITPSRTTTYSVVCNGTNDAAASATTTVTVVGASLVADHAFIASGESSMLTWNSANAASCTGTGFSTGGATSGTVSVTPSVTTTYAMTCSDASGVSALGLATVSVDSSGFSPDGSTLMAPPATGSLRQFYGDWTFSTQTAPGGYGILVEGANTGGAGIELVVANGGKMYALNDVGNWFLWDDISMWHASTNPIPNPWPAAPLVASPTSVNAGESSTLMWSSPDAAYCTGVGFSTGGATSGTVSVTPSVTTTYSVNCIGVGGTYRAVGTTVTVVGTVTTTFDVGARITTTDNVNVRNKANIKSGKVLCTQPTGSTGAITGGPSSAQGYIWWNVNFDAGCDGWVVQDYLALSAPVAAQTKTPAVGITHTLAVGWTGDEVSTLQSLLSKLGFFTGEVTGYFGTLTKQAVAAFQSANNLAAVGVVGPQTRALLNESRQ